jgi:hypothetical protein
VHNASPEVYGHVVATDLLGDAYVVPLHAILEEIKDCFGAAHVGLPTADSFTTEREDRATILNDPRHSSFRKTLDGPRIRRFDSPQLLSPNGSNAVTREREIDCPEFAPSSQTTDTHDNPRRSSPLPVPPVLNCSTNAHYVDICEAVSPATPVPNYRGQASSTQIGGRANRTEKSRYSKGWDRAFSTQREFKEDWSSSYMEKKRKLGANGDWVDLFLQDSEGATPSCKLDELKATCRRDSLDILSSTPEAPKRAWLDERSCPNHEISSTTRRHKNPLNSTQLLKCLQVPVCENHSE